MRAIKEATGNLSRKDSKYLSLAKKVAQTSDMRNMHGAVVVKSNRVLSVGVNKFKNDPKSIGAENVPDHASTHAEADAIARAGDPDGATIYVARMNRQGDERMSRPCDVCYAAIRKAGINKIIFTDGKL